MSNGKTHEKVNIFYLVLILVLALTYFMWDVKTMILVIAGYLVGTYWMNPDLDIKSKPYNNWLFLKYLWKPYQQLGHRSVWTHGYVIGDIVRYLYLFLLFLGFAYLFSFLGGIPIATSVEKIKHFYFTYTEFIWFFFFGNVLSSSAHIFQDHMSSGLKQFRKKYLKIKRP